MKKKYDFILFEHLYWHRPHYEVDLKNLADILINAGFSVAVINYLSDNKYHSNQRYKTFNIFPRAEFPKIENVMHEKNKLKRILKKQIFTYKRYKFFKEIYDKVKDLSNNFYFGTFNVYYFPFLFIKNKKIIFLWGVRSFWLNNSYIFINFLYKNINPINLFKALILKYIIKYCKRYVFFVSNIFIKKEFIELGIDEGRLILRPERTIKKIDFNLENVAEDFTLLTVGFIREQKNLEFAINTIKNTNIKYIIAGLSKNKYGEKINQLINRINSKNIIRMNKFLSKKEYDEIMQQMHFLIICDHKSPSAISNGTLLEAVLKGRPVIVPDQEPYNYYIDKYNIGLKYKPNNKESLLKAINKAKELGSLSFRESIIKFQKKYILDNVANDLKIRLCPKMTGKS